MINDHTEDHFERWMRDYYSEEVYERVGKNFSILGARIAGRLDCALDLGREYASNEAEKAGFRELQALSETLHDAIPRQDADEMSHVLDKYDNGLSEVACRLLDTWAKQPSDCDEEEPVSSGPYPGYSAAVRIETWENPTLSDQHEQSKPFLHSGRFVSTYQRRLLDCPVRVEYDPRVDMATLVAALQDLIEWVTENHAQLVTTEGGVNNFDLDDFLSD